MAYEPNQPWDKTLSYSYSQTCTYNGLTYTFFRQDGNSTPGIEPNKEEALFYANSAAPDGGTDSRMERCWTIFTQPAYTNGTGVRPLQPSIRGTPPSSDYWFAQTAEYTGNQYHGYWSPNVQDFEYSWSFYGQPFGMSADLGKPHIDPFNPDENTPGYDGNGNIVIDYKYDYIGSTIPAVQTGSIPSFYYWLPPDPPPDPPAPNTYYFDTMFVINAFNEVKLSTYNCFNRTAHYTVKYKITNNTVFPPIITEYSFTGEVSTGPIRDNWEDLSSYPRTHHSISWSAGETMSITSIKLTDITPRFDA